MPVNCGTTICANDGRYITDGGTLLCGLHDLQVESVSIRLSDVPALLALLGNVAAREQAPGVPTEINALHLADLRDMLKLIQKRGVTFK